MTAAVLLPAGLVRFGAERRFLALASRPQCDRRRCRGSPGSPLTALPRRRQEPGCTRRIRARRNGPRQKSASTSSASSTRHSSAAAGRASSRTADSSRSKKTSPSGRSAFSCSSVLRAKISSSVSAAGGGRTGGGGAGGGGAGGVAGAAGGGGSRRCHRGGLLAARGRTNAEQNTNVQRSQPGAETRSSGDSPQVPKVAESHLRCLKCCSVSDDRLTESVGRLQVESRARQG